MRQYIGFALFVILSGGGMSACAVPETLKTQTMIDQAATHEEPRPYDPAQNAKAAVQETLHNIGQTGKLAIIAMGTNGCHDSRAFAAYMQSARLRPLLQAHYEVLYIDVGQKDRNLDIAQSFGLDGISGTPTVFIVNAKGQVLNLDTAPSWRNAASRSTVATYDYFAAFTQTNNFSPTP